MKALPAIAALMSLTALAACASNTPLQAYSHTFRAPPDQVYAALEVIAKEDNSLFLIRESRESGEVFLERDASSLTGFRWRIHATIKEGERGTRVWVNSESATRALPVDDEADSISLDMISRLKYHLGESDLKLPFTLPTP